MLYEFKPVPFGQKVQVSNTTLLLSQPMLATKVILRSNGCFRHNSVRVKSAAFKGANTVHICSKLLTSKIFLV